MLTDVANGAEVTVVAGGSHGRVVTADVGLTGADGAGVAVIAVGRDTNTFPSLAGVFDGAGIAIVAGPIHGLVEAGAVIEVAGIEGAGVAILAALGRPRETGAQGAGVGLGAGVAIVARQRLGQIGAAAQGIAGVYSARVPIVAGEERSALASAFEAEVTQGAVVAVVAGVAVKSLVDALARVRGAATCRAGRVGLAVHRLSQTGPIQAIVFLRAGTSVVADEATQWQVCTPGLTVAGVHGAGVPVVAGQSLPDAQPVLAEVSRRADAAVVTRSLADGRLAHTVLWSTGILCAGVAIVTDEVGAGATAGQAAIIEGAEGTVVASKLVVRHRGAATVLTASA